MEQPFIFKYRPKELSDFEMSPTIIQLIQTLIDAEILNILFVGNSGTGKSSLINCIITTYYNNNYDPNDVLIINSLKDQGIAYYRSDVKVFCQTMPSKPNKKKILVLDDFDNINEYSQQVFINYIDKYSKNVFFLTSCSNTQKIIDSYQSRVFIIKIKPLEPLYLNNIIDNICNTENIKIEDKAKHYILSLSNNSIRTLISYLEKFKLLNCYITYNIVINTSTNISFDDFYKYINYCINNDLIKAIEILYNIYDRGYSVIDILDNLYIFVKMNDILKEEQKYIIIKCICQYIIIFYNIHENEIELAFLTNTLISVFKE